MVTHLSSHLYPLELSVTPHAYTPDVAAVDPPCTSNTGEKVSDEDTGTPKPKREERPTRKAAKI